MKKASAMLEHFTFTLHLAFEDSSEESLHPITTLSTNKLKKKEQNGGRKEFMGVLLCG